MSVSVHRNSQASPLGFLRLPQVLALVPVCKSSWWAGVKSGRYPAPVKIGKRATAWRADDIYALIDTLSSQGAPQPTSPGPSAGPAPASRVRGC